MQSRGFWQITTLVPPSPDGIGGAAYKLHTLLRARGIPTGIITSKDQEKSEGVHCLVKKWTAWSFVGVLKIVKGNEARNVILHYPSMRFHRYLSVCFLPLYFKIRGVKTTLFLHEFASYTLIGKVRSFLVMLWCNHIITVDSPNYYALIGLPFLKQRISLLPTGSNVRISKTTPSKRSKVERRRLLYFGFVQEGKGLDVVLDAFDNSEYLRCCYQLRIVGRTAAVSKPSEEVLMERVGRSTYLLHDNYLNESELQEALNSTDLFVLPFTDGVSERRTSFMTGMAFGKAIVTTKPRVPINGLVHLENVIYLDEPSQACLENTLANISSVNDETLECIGEKARAWYDSRFSDERLMDKFVSIFEKDSGKMFRVRRHASQP